MSIPNSKHMDMDIATLPLAKDFDSKPEYEAVVTGAKDPTTAGSSFVVNDDDEDDIELLPLHSTCRVARQINQKHARNVTKTQIKDLEALGDILAKIDVESGLSFQALSHLDASDTDSLLTNSSLAHQVMVDLVQINQKYQTALVAILRSKEQVDIDNYKMEHILRQTVATLEERRAALEEALAVGELRLKELNAEVESQREVARSLVNKMKLAREHLIVAGVFPSATGPP